MLSESIQGLPNLPPSGAVHSIAFLITFTTITLVNATSQQMGLGSQNAAVMQ